MVLTEKTGITKVSENRVLLVLQGVAGLAKVSWMSAYALPKQARYQLRYTRLFSFYPAGRILPKNRGARWMPFPDPARNTLFQRRACGRRRARMLRYAGRSSASALPAARVFPFCAPRRRDCLRFSPRPQAGAVQKHPWAVYARIGPGQAANNLFTALQRKHYTRFFSP